MEELIKNTYLKFIDILDKYEKNNIDIFKKNLINNINNTLFYFVPKDENDIYGPYDNNYICDKIINVRKSYNMDIYELPDIYYDIKNNIYKNYKICIFLQYEYQNRPYYIISSYY